MESDIEMTDEQIDKMKKALILARHMRLAQQHYFRTRSKDDLIASKRLETSLDVRLLELEDLGLMKE